MPVRLSPAGAPSLRSSLTSLDTVITREIEAVRRAVVEARFPHDPMLGAMSQISSLAASLVRRHGLVSATVLARAVDVLADGRLEVLPELSIPLTRLANDLVRANAPGRVDRIDLPPEGVYDGMYRADAVVISEELGTAWIVEIKRYNASYGRKHLKALQRLEVARLSATPILRGAYRIADVQTVLVSLYGETTHPGVVTRDGIDQFFGLELQSVLDRLDQVYAAMAAQVLNAKVRSDLALVARDEIVSCGRPRTAPYGEAGDDGDASDTAAGAPRVCGYRTVHHAVVAARRPLPSEGALPADRRAGAMSRCVIDIATRRSSGKSKNGSLRPAIEAAKGQADAATGVVVSIGTPTRIGAALRAVRRDLPAEVLHAHLHDLKTCGDANDLSVKLVGQWLKERVRVVTAAVPATPNPAGQ